MDASDITDGLTEAEIEHLEYGPHGYQTEPGFQIVLDDPRVPDGIEPVALVMVLCRSDRQPVPQLRYLSPHELERGVLEVRDRLVCVRIRRPGDPLSVPVVGGADDVAEVAAAHGAAYARGLGLRGLARMIAGLVRIQGLLGRLVARL